MLTNKNKPKKEITKQGSRLRDFLAGTAFLFPSALGVLIFFVLPFGVVIYYSLIRSPLNPEWVGLKNYIDVWNNGSFQIAVKNTVTFSVVAVPLAVVLALVLALILESRIPVKSLLRTFFLSPMMVPVASVILVWQVLFHYNGVANQLLEIFGTPAVDWLYSDKCQIVIILLYLWKNLGYNMILFMASLNNIPKSLIEAAEVEGASPGHIFFHIKLRYLSPTVLFVTILSLINSFKVFREVYLLTGNYPYEGLYTLQHFMNNIFMKLDYQRLSAAAVLLALVMVVIIALLFLIEDRFGKDVEQ